MQPTYFLTSWLAAHNSEAERLGKVRSKCIVAQRCVARYDKHPGRIVLALEQPLMLEEFGHSAQLDVTLITREAFFNTALSAIEVFVASGAATCGSAFWTWYPSQNRDAYLSDMYAVFTNDAALVRMGAHAEALARSAKSVPCAATS